MFRLFLDEIALQVFNKLLHEDQARLAQVDKQFNEISKNKSSELAKYKSKCTVHSVGHTHLVLQGTFGGHKQPFFFHAMKGNKKAFDHDMGLSQESYNEYMAAMKGDTLSLIKELSHGGATSKKSALLLKEALEEENRATFKI